MRHDDAKCNGACEYGLPCTGIGITILGGIPRKVSREARAAFAPAREELRKFKEDLKKGARIPKT
jgi:hypothetical protein